MRDSAIKNINGINNDKFPPYRNNSFILFKIIESLGAPYDFLITCSLFIFRSFLNSGEGRAGREFRKRIIFIKFLF